MKEHGCLTKQELLEQTKANINKFGFQVIMVKQTDYSPSFAYSIGLYEKYNHPEIICFGLPIKLLHEIINDVVEIVKVRGPIETSKNYTNIFASSRAEFIAVDSLSIKDYFGAAINYYGKSNFPAMQLVWTDRKDKFPWEKDFEEEFLYAQPLLDRNMDFRFREPANLTSFTSRQWLEEQKPILQVFHDHDGDWQFLTGDQEADDIRIVALDQLVKRDRTLNEIFDLQYGEFAERKFIGAKWEITKMERDSCGDDSPDIT